jgi:hypothetical protein
MTALLDELMSSLQSSGESSIWLGSARRRR